MGRVLLVHQPVDGGVGRHVADLAGGLQALGHEVILCGPQRPEGAPPGCSHLPIPMDRAISPARDLAAARQLRRVIAEVSPDVVHAHSSKAGAVARLVRVTRRSVPLVYTPHGYAFAGSFEREWERSAYRGIEAGLSALGGLILCVCEAEARLARRVARPRQIRVVHNGIRSPEVSPVPDPRMVALASQGPLICTLTQLRPGKGVETLLDALPAVREALPDVQLAIWGQGAGLEALRERARAAGVERIAHFLGATSTPLPVIAGGGVFAMTSLHEAFPYVILEAMATGRPIVASEVGGVGEAIDDHRTGVLVAPGEPAGLGEALIAVLRDPALGRRLGEAAAARVRTEFTLERMVDGTARVYAELSPRFLDGGVGHASTPRHGSGGTDGQEPRSVPCAPSDTSS